MRRLALATLACATCEAAVGHAAVELPLKEKGPGGSFAARLAVGTPPQQLWLRVDSASQWTYIPDAEGLGAAGFSSSNSSTAELGDEKSITFVDGSSVSGVLLRDNVEIGGLRAAVVPLLLARNATPPASIEGLGLLGLTCFQGSDFGAGNWNLFSGDAEQQGLLQRGLFQYFWEQHPEVLQSFRLELGGPAPRLLVGAAEDAAGESREEGGVSYLSTIFTSRSAQWFASVRAIGLSIGSDSPSLHWNLDFNALLPYGAPALLDSGSEAIRFGSIVYGRFLLGLPPDCRSAAAKFKGTTCPCSPDRIEEDFPSISISFESAETFRFLGLDSGADVIVCIPPKAYVSYDPDLKQCLVAVSDGGPHHMKFGFEAVVLGLPFFRSTAVVLDVQHRRIGIGPELLVMPPAPAPEAPGEISGRSMQQVGPPQAECCCADPKNWWSTGKRFSPRRVLVVVIGVSALVAYIFVAHSPSQTAEGLREMAEGLCGAAHDDAQQPFQPEQPHFPNERPADLGAPPRAAGAGASARGGGGGGGSSYRDRRNAAAARAAERRLNETGADRPLIQMQDRTDLP